MRAIMFIGAVWLSGVLAAPLAAQAENPAGQKNAQSAAGNPAAAKIVTLAADEWCPYNCRPDAAAPGYMVEIVRLALAKHGWTLNYVVSSWPRALADAEVGRVDGVIGASKSEFKKGIFPRVAQGRNDIVLVLNDDSPFVYSGPPSLRGIRLAAAKNYSYDQGPIDAYLASEEGKVKVEFASGDEVQSQNIRKLLARRVDAWIENRAVVQMTIAEISPLPSLKFTPVGSAEGLFVAFSPTKADAGLWADMVAAETANLRKSGELSLILAKYNLRDWE